MKKIIFLIIYNVKKWIDQPKPKSQQSDLSGVVMIELVGCKNLKAMDADGYSDPYVKISLGKQRFKSRVDT